MRNLLRTFVWTGPEPMRLQSLLLDGMSYRVAGAGLSAHGMGAKLTRCLRFLAASHSYAPALG